MRLTSLFLVTFSVFGSVHLASAQEAADTILYNGKILTVDSNFRTAQAVAVRSSQIAAVGTNDEVLSLAGPNTLRIDLKGKTVTPGLINTHEHIEEQHLDGPRSYARGLPATQLKRYALNFRQVRTTDDVLKQIRDIIAAFNFPPGQWLFFTTDPRGPDQAQLVFNDLNRWELDKAAPDNPIALTIGIPYVNGMMLNSKGIEALWAKHGDFVETYGRYWIDSSGRPTGILEPPAVRILLQDEDFLPTPEPEDVALVYRKLLEEFAAAGITTISGALHTSTVRAYQWLDSRGQMPLRYGYGEMSTFGIPGADVRPFKMGAGTDTLFIASISARAVDGSGSRMCTNLERDSQAVAEGGDASVTALSASSEWWPRGQCSLDIEYGGGTNGASLKANYFMEFYNELAQAGLRTANVHVAGDDSHSRLMSAYERIDRVRPGAVKDWAMDHCRLIEPRDIARAAKLGLMWSCAPPGRGGLGEVAEAFGEEVAHTYWAPIKTMLEAGINVSLEGGDNFWGEIQLLITRKDRDGKVWGAAERLDRETALRIATQNGANYVLKGDKFGSIEPGKFADLLILDRDYMSVPEEEISEIQTLMTMMGGKFIFLHTDFANEYDLRPEGAIISTYEELVNRRSGSSN